LSDNVEIFERMIAAFNEGGIDAVLEFYAEDAEFYDPDMPGDGTARGREGVRRTLEQLLGGNEETHVRGFELIPVGDRIVALTRTYARGADGAEIEMSDGHALTFRDGKVIYWRMYTDRSEALADVGLGPDGSPMEASPDREAG
jgi:ketosteroid isomerase-like protein